MDPGRGRGAVAGGGEVCPGPGDRIVRVEVVEGACTGWIRNGCVNIIRVRASRMRMQWTNAWLAAVAAYKATKYLSPPRRLR
jgi:hypothetical protein